ncbi:MAG TPA: hypothetical protein VEY51_19365 [Chondromyces sp.]|nr:hypothetical protein [Chondromyces sp.]
MCMFWNDYGCRSNNCGGGGREYEGNVGGQYDRQDILGDRNRRRCDCRDLFRGVSRNDFVKVQLKSSESVKGFFLGIFGDVVILFDEHKGHINSTTICCEDVVSVVVFNNGNNDRLNDKIRDLEDKIEDLLRRNRKDNRSY